MHRVIGLIAGSFKPYTAGHNFLVEKAASECDQVILFVSTGDRARPGELPIQWNGQMEVIWHNFIEKSLPSNVKVIYTRQPIKEIYDTLIEANANDSNVNSYIVYSDAKDLVSNYSQERQNRLFPRLLKNHQITFKPFERGNDSPDISGTIMRKYLETGNIKDFAKGLPPKIKNNAPMIYHILGGKDV